MSISCCTGAVPDSERASRPIDGPIQGLHLAPHRPAFPSRHSHSVAMQVAEQQSGSDITTPPSLATVGQFRSYVAPAEGGVYPHVLGVLAAVMLIVIGIGAYSAYQWFKRQSADSSLKDASKGVRGVNSLSALKISHSLPEIKEVQRSENVWIAGGHKVAPLRQITLPIVPTRHQTFRRQLAQEPGHLPFEVCHVAQRSSLPVGNIQPELYRPELLQQSSSESAPDSPGIPEATEVTYGKLLFTLKYNEELEGLVVRILEARDLPAKDFSGSSDPYIRIYLLPDRKKKFQTRVHRKTLNPVFNETFVFPVPFCQLGSRTLQFSVYDFDRFSRHDLIGHVIIKGLSELGDISHEVECTMDILGDPKEQKKVGELMLSLCYLPTAGRLTVTIIKARNLKARDIKGTSDPYVKVSLVCQGRRIKKKKTTIHRNTLNPVFNEALVFDVPTEHTDDVLLIIKVLDYDRVTSNDLIGCCTIGGSCIGQGRDHWLAMLENPRKPVAQWYTLLEAVPPAQQSTKPTMPSSGSSMSTSQQCAPR